MAKLFLPVSFILLASLVILSSISTRLFQLQAMWILIGMLIIFLFLRFELYSLLNYKVLVWGIYIAAIGLLLTAYFTAPVIRNVRSWVVFGGFTLQPVELAKIALILVYAQFFSRRHLAVAHLRNIFASFILFAIPAGLTALQPDLGSTSVLFGIWFGFLLVSGLPRKRIIGALMLFILIGTFSWFNVLKDYQRNRIHGLFYPQENALSVNYSAIQSKIAIGSAGLLGKGYGQGSQTQLGFLTEPSNDFILAAFIEEWGIVLGLCLISAFVWLVLSILQIGLAASQNFEKFICLGVALVFSLHFLINAGSTVGLFPVVGVTFPFLSYGGSSLLTNFFLLAMISAIQRRS